MPGRAKVKGRLEDRARKEGTEATVKGGVVGGWGQGGMRGSPSPFTNFRKLHIPQGCIGQEKALLSPDSMPDPVHGKYMNRQLQIPAMPLPLLDL